ncbi:ABC transporter ATP-binding protein [Antrihabitans sp. YC2-6]|uniref:ABC transporter ATP-binding protein n=1 Tax=Antrihabitans sp. YC2-6 TaxID=2799498 RepID=UPI0018F7CF01|nr:ABC transporter ATP-binding protein [Antrihabitans sp. YC2-6]MBJ8347626.1 ABC transporter ATP-binding protein [Antrihabitans sp. YC2-6]
MKFDFVNGFPVIGAAVLLALYLGVAVGARLRPHRFRSEPGLESIPLVVRGLSKSIGGTCVVADVSFDVRRGRIVGLLGPNGAGKTTILRMLVGLAEPDTGSAFAFGYRIEAGVPVLSRIGVCIESPGLMPHLSGWDNLRSLWSVTGRPFAESAIDDVARLSGLGTALQRKVSEYSLGMRHRLALAQAMLGLPELLILDEPAHGLDPTQIRFLRTMLREYAASGRTVLISSHHLEEVELTCSDVILVRSGSVVLAGAVDELSTRTTSLLISVDRPDEAEALYAGVAGVTCRADGATLHLDVMSTDLADALRPLVEAGIAVRSVQSRSRLEDVYFAAVENG